MPDGRVALGIDVGGTKVALALVRGDGTVLSERRVTNREHADTAALLEAVAAEAASLAQGSPGVIEAVGVGICELVDLTGEITSSSTIPWKRSDLEQALSGLGPVTIEADVRAAARAEAVLGAGRSLETFGYVTIGTGISSTFVRDGEPWLGDHGAAQLLGSARIALPCDGATLERSLEDVASGAAITRRYRERTGSELGESIDVMSAAAAGDRDAQAVLAEAVTTLGSFLAMFVNLLDPGALVLGGGLTSSGPYFIERVIEAVRSFIWASEVRSTPIVIGELGANAGAIGAAWSALGGGPG